MATLVLSAVGMMVGGPIGATVGSFIGQAIDRRIFAPPGVKGPRIGDLTVQTSTYGSPLPRIYGTMRVAGTVIWATDLIEQSHSSGGGKSGPSTKTYTYSASFAVALAARPGLAVKRIWADGKLLKGHKGDLKRRTRFRFYPGSEDQPVDPLIASIEGAGSAPAYRGICYVVFEDLELGDFGNRIPQLSFELEADAAPVPLAEIMSDVSGGIIRPGETDTSLAGYAAHGDTRRSAIESLCDLFGANLVERQGSLFVCSAEEPVSLPPANDRGCSSRTDEKGAKRESRRMLSAGDLPTSLSLAYYDAARDYQLGVAQAAIDGGGRGAWRVDAAAVIETDAAKSIANRVMAAQWAKRCKCIVTLPPEFLTIAPGETALLPGSDGSWLVDEVLVDGMTVRASMSRTSREFEALPADAGRNLPAIDLPVGENEIRLIDIPALDGGPASRPKIWLALASERFMPAPVKGTMNDVDTMEVRVERPATMAKSKGALKAGMPAWLQDEVSQIEVALIDEERWLTSADATALGAGCNMALIGDEIVQFGRAEPMGGGRFRLSSFRRGRVGTEWAMDGHMQEEPFLLLEMSDLVEVAIDRAVTGATLCAQSFGIADDPIDPPTSSIVITAEAMRPLAPCPITIEQAENGAKHLSWQLRDRRAWAWGMGDPADTGTAKVQISLDDGRFHYVVEGTEDLLIPADVSLQLPNPCPVTIQAITAEGPSRPWRQYLQH